MTRMDVMTLEGLTGLPDFEAKLNVPHAPPPEWFSEIPDWFDPNRGLIHVQMQGPEEGRVAALVAPWDECILDGKEGCWLAPPSPTGYEFAHVGTTLTSAGHGVRTANIGGGVNHADVRWPMNAAVDHYSNTASRLMRGRYVDTPNGIVFLGMMEPGSTRVDALAVMASALSGDWRWVERMQAWDMAGSQLVNNPGFRPVPLRSAEFAITASMPMPGDLASPGAVIGNWRMRQPPEPDGTVREHSVEDLGETIERLSAALLPMLSRLTSDVPLVSPTVESDDDDDEGGDEDGEWGDDEDDVARSVFGCPKCGGDGCRHCAHTGMAPYTPDTDDWGYDMADELDDNNNGIPDRLEIVDIPLYTSNQAWN